MSERRATLLALAERAKPVAGHLCPAVMQEANTIVTRLAQLMTSTRRRR